MIQPIVEGHGEVPAVPVLLRKLAELMAVPFVQVGAPIRSKRSQLGQEDGMRRAVAMARAQPGCRAILVLLDADDDCPKTEAPRLLKWATEEAAPLPCAVVMANREYEGWLLGCAEVLLRARGIPQAQPYPGEPETKRDARGALEALFGRDFHYIEREDQPALTALADWQLVHQRCRSFRKMVKDTRRLLEACGFAPTDWAN